MEIVGRIEEIKILREHFQNNESSFLAIYGRRRVGKTYLIRQVYNKNIVFGYISSISLTILNIYWFYLIVKKTIKPYTVQPKLHEQ